MATGSKCDKIGKDCFCTEEKCNDLQNTFCNKTSGACECVKGYHVTGRECIKPEGKYCNY